MRTHCILCVILASITLATSAPIVQAEEPIDIGNRRELFVDPALIESLEGTRLQLHHPTPREDVLQFDRPWEGAFCGYVTVLRDGDLYRMYYRGLPSAGRDGSEMESTCYAESRDGIVWEKPNLGLFEVEGSKENNTVLKGVHPHSHNFSPFLDTNPDCDPMERFKGLGGTSSSGLHAYVSPDGIHWTHKGEGAVIREGALDSQNVPFWSEHEKKYLCYLRTWSKGEFEGYRSISRTVSDDFIRWSSCEEMTFGGTAREHLYTNQTHPYFRAPHLYLAVAARFFPGKRVLSEAEAESTGVNLKYYEDISDNVLMSSRGGTEYDRSFMEGFIRPGIGLGNWTSRTNYPALGIVPTGEEEISIYIQRNYGQPDHHLQRTTLRTDGFVSVSAPYEGGEFLTKPFRFEGKELEINYSTSAAGSIVVEIQSPSGEAFAGFGLADCDTLIGDRIARAVTWKSSSDVSTLSGKPVRLRFKMKDSDLYSLKFNP